MPAATNTMKRNILPLVLLCFIAFLFLGSTFPAHAQKSKKRKSTPILIRSVIASTTVYGGETQPNLNSEQKRRWDSFTKIWYTLNDNYFDQTSNGLDWNKVKADYKAKVVAVKNDSDFHRLMQEMIYLLDCSHFAIIPPEVYREIERARTLARSKEKVRLEKNSANTAEGEEPDDDLPFIDESRFKYGIGVELRYIKGQFVITRVEKDSAAEYAGVKAGYIIDTVNDVSMSEMMSRSIAYYLYIRNFERYLPAQIVDWFLNGEKDSQVQITCLDGTNEPVDFTIRRELLRGEMISIGKNYPEQYLRFESRSLTDTVGYIRFNLFSLAVIGKYCDAISSFKDKEAIVVDLRGNSGGVLGTIPTLTGMLTDTPIAMGTSIYRVGSEPLLAKPKAKQFRGKVVILVDKLSLSAAALFTAGLRDNSRAFVVGEQTGGEALPAISTELPTGGVFVYPIANFKTKSGKFLEGSGVTPDFITPVDRGQLLLGKDVALEKALALIADNTELPRSTPVALTDGPGAKGFLAPPAPKPTSKTIMGDRNISSAELGKPLAPPPVARPLVFRAIAPPTGSMLSKNVVPKDARSLKLIADFFKRTGGEQAWREVKTYSATGRNSITMKGTVTELEFKAYRRDPDRYAAILSSPVAGEIRELYHGKTALMQTDLGIDQPIYTDIDITKVDLFYPLRTLLDADEYESLSFTGTFDRSGRKSDLIEAKTKSGETVALAFDSITKMLVGYATRGAAMSFDDYRQTGKVMMPYSIEVSSYTKITLDKLILNEKLDDSLFEKKVNCFDIPNDAPKGK